MDINKFEEVKSLINRLSKINTALRFLVEDKSTYTFLEVQKDCYSDRAIKHIPFPSNLAIEYLEKAKYELEQKLRDC